MSDFPSSRFERGKIFAKTGLKVGRNYAKYHLKKTLDKKSTEEARKELNKRNANDLYREFTQLRGTALKIAQTLSMDTSGLISEEFIDIMSQAQYRVPPINKALVRTLVKKELGDWPEKIFHTFDTDAIAAASIGQVHKAITKDGEAVAVKIQYPNIRETIDSDLSLVKSLFRRMVHTSHIDEYFEEIRDRLIEETDYIHEGEEMEFFADRYSNDRFVTPRWFPGLSTGKLLTMTYLDGKHLDDFLDDDPGQELKNKFGQLMWDFFHHQINSTYTIHADAHPGNFLYMENDRLGILDFGCIKTFPEDFFCFYIYALPAHLENDRDKLEKLYQHLEMFPEREKTREKREEYFAFFQSFGRCFIQPYEHDFFDFSNPAFRKDLNHFIQKGTSFDEPVGSRHFIYASRVHVGLYNMLMRLEAVIDTRESREIIDRFLKNHGLGDAVTNFASPNIS